MLTRGPELICGRFVYYVREFCGRGRWVKAKRANENERADRRDRGGEKRKGWSRVPSPESGIPR